MIRVEDLVKRYRKAKRNAVDGISFSVAAGEFFALLGPNGAGKTTTISILTTTLTPTSGRATIGGRDIVAEASAVRREVGIIFQRPSLDLNLTAEENVRFHAGGRPCSGCLASAGLGSSLESRRCQGPRHSSASLTMEMYRGAG